MLLNLCDTISIFQGDCLEGLRALPEDSVHCCVTSPPYWGLRDYGCEPSAWPEIRYVPMASIPAVTIPSMVCCLGQEPDPLAYVGHIVEVFREVRRVLREDGTLWLNLGDSYASSKGKDMSNGKFGWSNGRSLRGGDLMVTGLKAKDITGIPWRVALALQSDGWFLRQDIIWAKPNPMPESVRDRCTKAHEYLFLLSKSARYYFDAASIREPAAWNSRFSKTPDGLELEKEKPYTHKGSRFNTGKTAKHQLGRSQNGERVHGNLPGRDDGGRACNAAGQEMRNKRSVWTVSTRPCLDAHFATFPPNLVKPCILAGCPEGGIVLDPFQGRGTTGFVAYRLWRRYLGMELNPQYVTMSAKWFSVECVSDRLALKFGGAQ